MQGPKPRKCRKYMKNTGKYPEITRKPPKMHVFDVFDPFWSRDPQKQPKKLQNSLFLTKFGAGIGQIEPDLHLFAYYLGRRGFRVINGYYSGIIRVFNLYLSFCLSDPLFPNIYFNIDPNILYILVLKW